MDGSGADRFRAGRSGYDGTQPPPPAPLFPDPLAGLVTGERHYRPPASVVPVVAPPPPPAAAHVPPPRAPAARPAPVRAPAQAGAARSRPARSPVRSGQPAAHVPHAGLPRQDSVQQGRKKTRGGVIGCLVVLAALSGLLFNVLREIIEAVVDLLR